MIWSIGALVAFSFALTSSTTITCYDNSTTDTVSCDTYCEISLFPFSDSDDGYERSCSDTPVYCDIFGAVDTCIQATISISSYQYSCLGQVAADVQVNTTTTTGKVECCTTSNCNLALSNSCTTNNDLSTYFDYLTDCYSYTTAEVYDLANYSCGASTSTYYTKSSCNLLNYDVKNSQCGCDGLQYIYGLATTDAQRAAILTYTNITDYDLNETEYGCWVMSSCSITDGFSYSITSFSFSIDLSITGLTSTFYDPYSALVIVATSMNTAGYETTYEQVYINSVSLASDISGTATLNVNVQYGTMTEATLARTAVANGDVTFSIGVGSATITSTGSVQTTTYSSSDGNMNKFIGISLLISLISLLFH